MQIIPEMSSCLFCPHLSRCESLSEVLPLMESYLPVAITADNGTNSIFITVISLNITIFYNITINERRQHYNFPSEGLTQGVGVCS